MATIRTLDRTLALRCKRACAECRQITVSYETSGGWNRVTGMVQSVGPLKAPRFKPVWEITIIEQKGGIDAKPCLVKQDGSQFSDTDPVKQGEAS